MKYTITNFFFFFLMQMNFAQIYTFETSSSCGFQGTGEIRISIDQTWAASYPGLHTLTWENNTNGDYEEVDVALISNGNPTITFENMTVGVYEIRIEFDEQCFLEFEPEIQDYGTYEMYINGSIFRPDCYSDNESIYVTSFGVGSEYLYTWSNGFSNVGYDSYLQDLGVGTYCVTVTETEYCGISEQCFTLYPRDEPFINSISIDHLSGCDNSGNSSNGDGLIVLEILYNGANQPNVSWQGPLGYGGSGKLLYGLQTSGIYEYSIDVGNNCEVLTGEVELLCCDDFDDPLQLTLQNTWDCTTETGSLTAVASSGEPPYSYYWNTGNTSPSLLNVSANIYSVTVTDSRGCRVWDSQEFGLVEILEEIPACINLHDGYLKFKITNPNNYPVDIVYDFTLCDDCVPPPLVIDETSNPVIVELFDLEGLVDYTFNIYIDGCWIPFTFQIEEEEFERTFSHHRKVEEDFFCVYDIECKETSSEDGLEILAVIDLHEGECSNTDPLTPCGEIDYLCDGQVVETKKMRKKLMRRLQADMLAQALQLDPGEISDNLGGNPCDWIFVCPNDPLCKGFGFTGEFGGRFKGTEIDEDGCLRVKCRTLGLIGFMSYKICDGDYIPPFLDSYLEDGVININISTEFENCNRVEKRVYSLISYMNAGGFDTNGNFEGSTLQTFLLDNIDNPSAVCAKVRYCSNDLTFKWSDIEEVDCPPPSLDNITYYPFPPINGVCTGSIISDEDGFWADCIIDCPIPTNQICIGKEWISTDVENFNIHGFNSGTPHIALNTIQENAPFEKFCLIDQDSNRITVSAILQNETEEYYLPFLIDKWDPTKFNKVEYVYENLANSYTLILRKNLYRNLEYNLYYGPLDNPDTINLVSTDELEFTNSFTTLSQEHYFYGTFKGNVTANNQSILQSISVEDFVLHYDKNMNLVNSFSLSSIGMNLIKNKDFPGKIYQSKSANSSIDINGNVYNSSKVGEIVEANLSGTYENVSSNLSVGSYYDLVNLSYDSATQIKHYLLFGKGRIYLNSSPIYYSPDNVRIIVAVQNNNVLWINEIGDSEDKVETLEVINGDNGELFLAINFKDTLHFDNEAIASNGDVDILIVSFNGLGDIGLKSHYGSPSEELVKELFFSDDVLYLGGDISGPTLSRTIGEINFAKFNTTATQGFISFIAIEVDETNKSLTENTSKPINSSEVNFDHDFNTNLQVFPNPATNELFFQVDTKSETFDLRVVNSLGKIIHTNNNIDVFSNQKNVLDITSLENGLFFLILSSDTEKFISSFVKM